MKLESGDIYEGQFLDDEYDVLGILIKNNGEYYSGEWKAGKYHGLGTFERGDELRYIG